MPSINKVILAGNVTRDPETSDSMKNNNQFIQQPEWIRLPGPRGRCPISALSRTSLLDLGQIVPGLITRLKKAHCQRGTILVHVPTLRAYLETIRQQQIQKLLAKPQKASDQDSSLAASAKHEFLCRECGHTTVLSYSQCWGKIIRCAECAAIVADYRNKPSPK